MNTTLIMQENQSIETEAEKLSLSSESDWPKAGELVYTRTWFDVRECLNNSYYYITSLWRTMATKTSSLLQWFAAATRKKIMRTLSSAAVVAAENSSEIVTIPPAAQFTGSWLVLFACLLWFCSRDSMMIIHPLFLNVSWFSKIIFFHPLLQKQALTSIIRTTNLQ